MVLLHKFNCVSNENINKFDWQFSRNKTINVLFNFHVLWPSGSILSGAGTVLLGAKTILPCHTARTAPAGYSDCHSKSRYLYYKSSTKLIVRRLHIILKCVGQIAITLQVCGGSNQVQWNFLYDEESRRQFFYFLPQNLFFPLVSSILCLLLEGTTWILLLFDIEIEIQQLWLLS